MSGGVLPMPTSEKGAISHRASRCAGTAVAWPLATIVQVSFSVPKFSRHRYGEDAPLPSRQKMRRLALVGRTRLNPVIVTNRDVQLFLKIPIEIPEKQD